MRSLCRPRLKDPTPPPVENGVRCTRERHGREDLCPGCGARFSAVWWVKYCVNGRAVRESPETEKETGAAEANHKAVGAIFYTPPLHVPSVDRHP